MPQSLRLLIWNIMGIISIIPGENVRNELDFVPTLSTTKCFKKHGVNDGQKFNMNAWDKWLGTVLF